MFLSGILTPHDLLPTGVRIEIRHKRMLSGQLVYNWAIDVQDCDLHTKSMQSSLRQIITTFKGSELAQTSISAKPLVV
jgi:hypothetical protein